MIASRCWCSRVIFSGVKPARCGRRSPSMVSGLLPTQGALDPPQRQLRQNQHDAPPPLRRQRLPYALRMRLPHEAIQASARPRAAPCTRESVTRRVSSTYKRYLLWDIEVVWHDLKAHHLAHHTFADTDALAQAIHQAVDALNTERRVLPLAKPRIPA